MKFSLVKSNYKLFPHLVQESPWPLFSSMGALSLTGGSVLFWHYGFTPLLYLGLMGTLLFSFEWWSNIVHEKSSGVHNSGVVHGLHLGMILFITSEICFFVSFFWGFFEKCLVPESELGFFWPPVMFSNIMVDPFSIPLLKSILLLSSGVTITCAHHYILVGDYNYSGKFLFLTVLLGVVFLGLQMFEYSHSIVSINSSVYGSVFFLLTGFHGLHVTMGAMFLLMCLLRLMSNNISSSNHVGFETASWYWHFVDVVWLFLFFFVYWYGYKM